MYFLHTGHATGGQILNSNPNNRVHQHKQTILRPRTPTRIKCQDERTEKHRGANESNPAVVQTPVNFHSEQRAETTGATIDKPMRGSFHSTLCTAERV
jgi:hypothetical protein